MQAIEVREVYLPSHMKEAVMKKGLAILALVLVAGVSIYLGANAATTTDQTGAA